MKIPESKSQIPIKFQAPNFQKRGGGNDLVLFLLIEDWDLFGTWDLELPASAAFDLLVVIPEKGPERRFILVQDKTGQRWKRGEPLRAHPS